MSNTDCAAAPSILRRFALALAGLLLFLSGCETPSQPPEDWTRAAPPFYQVRGGRGATLHLFGTIHLGPPEGWSLPPEIDRALAQASTLVMEVDLAETTEENVSNAIMRHALLPDSASLSTLIGPETQHWLELRNDELIAAGLPPQFRDRLKPWFVAMSLVETAIRETRYTTSHSADAMVFASLGSRPLLALESIDVQLGLLDAISPALQELMLQDSLIRMDSAPDSVEELVQAWRRNDQPSLIRLSRESAEGLDDLEAFYEIVIDDRNRSWIPTLVDLLESPERAESTVFVAVGAMHLVGANSIPDLLQHAGYRVETGAQHRPQQTESP